MSLKKDKTSGLAVTYGRRASSPSIHPPAGYSTWLEYCVAEMDTRRLLNDHHFGAQPQWTAGVTRAQMRDAAMAELRLYHELRRGVAACLPLSTLRKSTQAKSVTRGEKAPSGPASEIELNSIAVQMVKAPTAAKRNKPKKLYLAGFYGAEKTTKISANPDAVRAIKQHKAGRAKFGKFSDL